MIAGARAVVRGKMRYLLYSLPRHVLGRNVMVVLV